MSEKLLARLVAAAVLAPVCAVCLLGPVLIASIFAGVAAWFGDFDAVVVVGLIAAAGIAAYEIVRKRGAQRTSAAHTGEVNQ